jgi:hypothetical protein
MIDGTLCVEARVSLMPAQSGGLQSPLPSGTRSLLLNFSALGEREGTVQIGAIIDVVGGSALEPGTVDATVRVRFWAAEAAIYATPGAVFELWHLRVIGRGVVERIVDDIADEPL